MRADSSAACKNSGVTVEPTDLARETAILADRCDISEEIVRLRAHLSQYHEIIDEPQSAGRKLEFVAQEIGREINTIGSKASDVRISRLGRGGESDSGKDSRACPKCRMTRDDWADLPGTVGRAFRPFGVGKEHACPAVACRCRACA